ncbi:hypothetical protein B0J17DRAFT_764447 [Rhizoctonia solani]|nr:hypothetical protein B0J17DRAFT_764447 [Rhizoctonia solani]
MSAVYDHSLYLLAMFSLTDIYSSIAFFLFFVYRRIYPPTPIMRPVISTICENPELIGSILTLSHDSGSRRSIPLPQETLDHIFSFYIASIFDDLRCSGRTIRDYRIQRKCIMRRLLAVAHCSRQFNRIMLGCVGRIWASCGLSLCSSKRYLNAADRPARCIRIITAEQDCLPLDINLAVHVMLEIASINYHIGVQWFNREQQFRRFRCVSAYPRSLRQLEILRSHTPEEEVIRLVSDCCPELTELRLVRCTLFNDPQCWYWRTHTRNQDHDYMKTHDPAAVVEYAVSDCIQTYHGNIDITWPAQNHMALLLCGLQKLESIHIGHYLINMSAVYTHRMDHRQHHSITDKMNYVDGISVVNNAQLEANVVGGPPIDPTTIRLADRALWADPCPQCEREFKKLIEIAERLAAGILVSYFKYLKHVSFANFISTGRVCPSSWLVGRQQRGPDLYVRTEDPNRPRSRIMQPMVYVDDRWQPPQEAQ